MGSSGLCPDGNENLMQRLSSAQLIAIRRQPLDNRLYRKIGNSAVPMKFPLEGRGGRDGGGEDLEVGGSCHIKHGAGVKAERCIA